MKQLFSITNAGECRKPVLLLRIGEKHCSFAVADAEDQLLHSVFYYTKEPGDETFLNELFIAHPELSGRFEKEVVCFDYSNNMLIPAEAGRNDVSGQLIASLFSTGATSVLVADAKRDNAVKIACAVPQPVVDRVKEKYPDARTGASCSFISASGIEQGKDILILADFGTDSFSVIVLKEGAVLFAQAYAYATPEDVMYYLLRVCNEMNVAQEDVKILLSGLIEQESALYKSLYQYFLHTAFRTASWQDGSDTYPSHFFTSLNDLYLCVS